MSSVSKDGFTSSFLIFVFPPSCMHIYIHTHIGFPGESVVKNLLANAGDTEDVGSIPGSGRFPGGGNDSPL